MKFRICPDTKLSYLVLVQTAVRNKHQIREVCIDYMGHCEISDFSIDLYIWRDWNNHPWNIRAPKKLK